MPGGFLKPDEAKLGEADGFLSDQQRRDVTKWWLEVEKGANTPNWDIASTCTMTDGRQGLLLVEAKAHVGELSVWGKPAVTTVNGLLNESRTTAAIATANANLNVVMPGFGLCTSSHYQLCNRFAWAWEIASLGLPVTLVYLGVLNAEEMTERGREPFRSKVAWRNAVISHSASIVPSTIWDGPPLDIGGTPLYAVIRALDMNWQ